MSFCAPPRAKSWRRHCTKKLRSVIILTNNTTILSWNNSCIKKQFIHFSSCPRPNSQTLKFHSPVSPNPLNARSLRSLGFPKSPPPKIIDPPMVTGAAGDKRAPRVYGQAWRGNKLSCVVCSGREVAPLSVSTGDWMNRLVSDRYWSTREPFRPDNGRLITRSTVENWFFPARWANATRGEVVWSARIFPFQRPLTAV